MRGVEAYSAGDGLYITSVDGRSEQATVTDIVHALLPCRDGTFLGVARSPTGARGLADVTRWPWTATLARQNRSRSRFPSCSVTGWVINSSIRVLEHELAFTVWLFQVSGRGVW